MSQNTSRIDWVSTLFLTLTPILAIILSVSYLYNHGITWSIVGLSVFFYYATGFSITAGYHRYFAHRTYEVPTVIKILYLFFGAGAFQNSVLKWGVDHRFHHKYVDTDNDPYNAKRGLLYSHILWMTQKSDDHRNSPMAMSLGRDMRQDKWIMWQDKYYVPIAIVSGFLLPAALGTIWGVPFGAFVFAGLFRMVSVHHFTFFINSLCHYWGVQRYTDQNTAKDNFILALFTYGEGYHNFHHYFQNDYRNGIRWFDFDPTKWFINFLSSLGFAQKLKMESDAAIINARVRMDELRLATKSKMQNHAIHEKLSHIREKIYNCGENLKKLQEEYNQTRLDWVNSKSLQFELLKRDLKMARKELKRNYSYWKKIVSLAEKFNYA